MHARLLLLGMALVVAGCAPRSVSWSTLSRVGTPAFVARTLPEAGPKAEVFRSDGAYSKRLGAMSASEADRRLAANLIKGMSRFEAAETLRAKVSEQLSGRSPWSNAASPAEVSRALQTLLVTEAESPIPDYPALSRIGVDAVVEFVVEDFGLRSRGGKAGTYLVGYGRMFRLDGGGDVWRRAYVVDQLDSGDAQLDPFRLVNEPQLFRLEMNTLVDAVVEQFVSDLSPASR